MSPHKSPILRQNLFHLLSLTLPALAVLALFYRVFDFEYVWDDAYLFVGSDALRNWDLALDALFQPVLPDSPYFRPLVLLSFALEFLWAGVDSSVSHGVNLGIHALNTFLVCWLADRLTARGGFSASSRHWRVLIAGFFYGLHPAMIEPASWVSSRFDLMVTLFTLLGLAAETKVASIKVRAPLLGLCFIAAAASKEMAATFPALLFLHQRVTRWRNLEWRELLPTIRRDREYLSYAVILMAGLLYLLLRIHFVGRFNRSDAGVISNLSASAWLPPGFVAETYLFYVRTVFWPFGDLGPLHPFDFKAFDPFKAGVALLAAGLCVLTLALGVAKRSRPLTLLAMASVALLPVLNIIPLTIIGSVGHERFMVLPLTFVALAVASLPPPETWFSAHQELRLLPRLFRLIGIAWLAAALVNVQVTLPLWRNDVTLWRWNYLKHPDHWYSQYVYLSSLINNNQIDLARDVSKEWVARGPLDAYVQIAYGLYLVKSGDPKEAVNYLLGVLDSLPPLHAEGGEITPEQARALPVSPFGLANGYQALAQAYLALEDYGKALEATQATLFYTPNSPAGLLFRSMALYGLDRPKEAEVSFNRAHAIYLPSVAENAIELRARFLKNMCSDGKTKPKHSCRIRNSRVSPSAPPAPSTPGR